MDINKKEILKNLTYLFEQGQIVEVRILKTNRGTISGYYDDYQKLVNDIVQYNGKYNIYMTLNEVIPDALARSRNNLIPYANNTTSDSEIKRRKYLFIDVDPIRISGVSATESEVEIAKNKAAEIHLYLKNMEFRDPIIAFSGNGYHLLYPIDLPNTKEITEQIKAFLQGLNHKFGEDEKVAIDTTTYNAARITKIYGTMSCKGDSTEERPHRKSKFLFVPKSNDKQITSIEAIRKVIIDCNENPIESMAHPNTVNNPKTLSGYSSKGKIDVEKLLADNNAEIFKVKQERDRTIYVLKSCPWNPEHTDHSASITQFENGGISAQCHHDSCASEGWQTLKQKWNIQFPKNNNKQNLSSNKNQEKKNPADIVIDMVIQSGDYLFADDLGEEYVACRIQDSGSFEVFKVGSKAYKMKLINRYTMENGKTISKEMINQAITTLQAQSYQQQIPIKLNYRCSSVGDAIYYDLGDSSWQKVEIKDGEWSIIVNSDILFKRTSLMKQQVLPSKQSTVKEIFLLNKYYRFKESSDHLLHIITLITSFLPIAHPITVYSGEQGASKTTSIRMDRAIIDPSKQDVLAFPNGIQDLTLSLNNRYVSAYDNVDKITSEQSSILCMAVTGGGIAKRKLYTDDEEVFYSYKVPIFINGIDVVAKKPDLLDRSIILNLERLSPGERKEESEIWTAFNDDLPTILGSIFTILAEAQRIYQEIQLTDLGRMAEFTKWGYVISEVIGIGGESFLSMYTKNQKKATEEALNSQPTYEVLMALLEEESEITMTPTALLTRLNIIRNREGISVEMNRWPGSANVLSRHLKSMKPNLMEQGIEIEFLKKHNGRIISIRNSVDGSV